MSHHQPFYGKNIYRDGEQAYIKKILEKYMSQPATEGLRQKVYEELMEEKHLGRVTIPFRVVMQRDPMNLGPPYLEIVLDTKV